jgi:hypothetical protein
MKEVHDWKRTAFVRAEGFFFAFAARFISGGSGKQTQK